MGSKRVQDFMYANEKETPYQVQQAKIAIANGGVLVGLGPGNSRQRNFLPQAYNDFIYSIIIEEYGLLGGAFMIFIYLVFLFRCIRIFRRCPYAFGAFLSIGIKLHISNTSRCKHGCKCEPRSGNRCNTSFGKYGRKLIPVYMRRNWDYTKCCTKCRTDWKGTPPPSPLAYAE